MVMSEAGSGLGMTMVLIGLHNALNQRVPNDIRGFKAGKTDTLHIL